MRSLDFLGCLDFPGQWLLADDNNSVFRPNLSLLVVVGLLGIKYLIGNGRSRFYRVIGKVPRLPLRPLRMKAIRMRHRKVVDDSNVLKSLSKGCILLLSNLAFIGMRNGYH